MTYLTLFLCSKFAIAIPFLAPHLAGRARDTAAFATYAHAHLRSTTDRVGSPRKGAHHRLSSDETHDDEHSGSLLSPIRNAAAAPPVYLLVIALIPIGTAIFISSTRWSDFRHHGFDILFGSILGFVSAWFAFRWYHLPIREGAGWSWGARSRDRAFGVGVGISGYVGDEGWSSAHAVGQHPTGDVELGRVEEPPVIVEEGINSTYAPTSGPPPVHLSSVPGSTRPEPQHYDPRI